MGPSLRLTASSPRGRSRVTTPRTLPGTKTNSGISTRLRLPTVWVVTKSMPAMQVSSELTPDSFREMYEANNTAFKPVDGDLPNTMLRFDLDGVKSKSTYFANNSEFNVLGAGILLAFLISGVYIYTQSQDESVEEKKLSKSGEKINQAKSQLFTNTDLKSPTQINLEKARKGSEANILADYEMKLKQGAASSSRRGKQDKSSVEEQRLKKLAPDLSAINPDAE